MSGLFPKTIDNVYRGSWLAVWLLAPVLLLKLFMAVNVMGLNPLIDVRRIITGADGIPLDTYASEVQELIIFNYATWGLPLLLLCVLAIVALLRYRAMLPLAIFMLAAEQIGRKALGAVIMTPAETEPAGFSIGAAINWGFSIFLVLALILSLTPRRTAA